MEVQGSGPAGDDAAPAGWQGGSEVTLAGPATRAPTLSCPVLNRDAPWRLSGLQPCVSVWSPCRRGVAHSGLR